VILNWGRLVDLLGVRQAIKANTLIAMESSNSISHVYSARAAYLQPALQSGAYVGPTTTVEATIRVTEPPPYQSALGLSRS
jgi:hypothetical protein